MTGVVEIQLPSGHVALIDSADHALVRCYLWHAVPSRDTTYVRGYKPGARSDGPWFLHRLLIDPPHNVEVDHCSGNGLDNRRQNLRLASHPQNLANQRLSRKNTSGFKGVSWNRSEAKWTAQIKKGRKRHLGYFTDPWEAAQAYNAAATEAWGEFARLNTREGGPR